MFKKMKSQLTHFIRNNKLGQEKTLMIILLVVGVLLSLWVSASPSSKNTEAHEEPPAELTVPAGFSIVPLELANAQALATLITREAVIDVFQKRQNLAVAENLKVIKLSAGEGPLFGALVPQKLAGQLQEIFSTNQLRGAIRTRGQGPAQFHLAPRRNRALLEEVTTADTAPGDNL